MSETEPNPIDLFALFERVRADNEASGVCVPTCDLRAISAVDAAGYARAVADVVAWLRTGGDALDMMSGTSASGKRAKIRAETMRAAANAIEQGAHVGAAGERP